MSDTKRLSLEQVKALVNYMVQHPDLATGALMRSLETRSEAKQHWIKLTKILHQYEGAKKTPIGWTKYFSDFKHKLKFKVLQMNRLKEKGLVSKAILTTQDKRLLRILGPEFGKPIKEFGKPIIEVGIPTRKSKQIDGYNAITETKVKTEDSRASSEVDPEDRLSETFDYDISQLSDAPNMPEDDRLSAVITDNHCPQWLVEVEKKRAEADLLRAKAEQQRSEVAAKNAEAALMQAQALLRLSDAADVQANAITRIANLLESRISDNLLGI